MVFRSRAWETCQSPGASIPHPELRELCRYHKVQHQDSLPNINKPAADAMPFPNQITCAEQTAPPHIVTNYPSGSTAKNSLVVCTGIDIEFEPIPLSTSMFYVQSAPWTRSGRSHLGAKYQAGIRFLPPRLIARVDEKKRETTAQW